MRRFLGAAFLTLALVIPTHAPAGEPLRGGTYRYPLRFSPKTLDPARSTDSFTTRIVQQLFDGLVDFDRDLNPIPSIARSWRVSRDGRVYTFELHDDVRFHNGRRVTAEDVVYSLTRLLHPDTRSEAALQFAVIKGALDLRQRRTSHLKGVRATDPMHVEIELENPYSPFLSLLATNSAKVVPREAVEGRDAPFERRPVGTGPFRFVRWKEGKEIIIEANPAYFRGRPHLDRIVYAILPAASDTDIYRTFRNGGFEESAMPADIREEALADGFIRIIRRPILGILFYGLNLSRPEWREPRVREAMLVALDRNKIAGTSLHGPHRPTAGLLPPGLPGYTPNRPVPRADRARALNLLREAGGVDRLPQIELWSAVRSQLAKAELAGIGEAWRSIGVTVETRYASDWPQFEQFLAEGRMSVYRYAWYADLPDPDNVLGVLFHSKSKYNYMRYENPEVDRLLELGRTELDPVRRSEIYQDAETRILADVPVIPFLQLWFEQAYHPYVKGVEVSPLGAPYIPMRKVWLDRSGPRERTR